jgi:hypothetical protein
MWPQFNYIKKAMFERNSIMKTTATHPCAFYAAPGKTLRNLGIIALGALAFRALAAEPPTHVNFREEVHMTYFWDMEVRDSQDQKIGIVKGFALDVEHGRVVEVIVTSGGFLGFNQRTAAVPPAALKFDPAAKLFRLNASKATFKAAPDFAMSKWTEHCQSSRVAEVYRYYGQEPYFAADGQDSKSGNTATEPLGHILLGSKLLGFPVKNLQNELLGFVSNFLCDLPSDSRLIHVIVQAPGSKHMSVVQARALRYNATHDALSLDLSTEAFKNEPRFKWTDSGKGGFQQETYENTEVAANDGVNTRQNVREGTTTTYTPLAQGASFRDVDKTYRIYAAMRTDTNLSHNAQNVEVGTLNGRTTLRGHVNTEEGKRIIGEIAEKAGQPENVSNLLEVRLLPVTNKPAK